MKLTEETLSRLGMEVPLPKIDRALQELWASDENKTRSSLINFAIYSEDPESLVRNNELLEKLTAEHSCRALLITSLPESQPQRVRAWINALCRPYQGRQVVCSEQLSFVLEGGDAAQIQNVVFAHLDSDLPLYVWWQGLLTERFDERLYSRIHTLIIDSSRWAHPRQEFAHLMQARAQASFDVRDLSWTRSHYLRMAMANLFQDPKTWGPLSHVQTLEISYAAGQRAAALLLACWISQRLSAQAEWHQDQLVLHRLDAMALRVSFQEVSGSCALPAMKLLGPGFEVVIARPEGSAYVHTTCVIEGQRRESLLPADGVTESELISSQLSRAGGQTRFADVLPLLGQLLR
jgi:hypothetical protein